MSEENTTKNKAEKGKLAELEEEVLAYWQEKDIFKKTLKKENAPKGEFVFYDGPPFATGLPHYGHILAGTIKDVIPRYQTMKGHYVRRRWGWDCHGLPLENEIEKELGLKTKKDIEELGVGKFNAAAKNAVLRYADDWKKIVPRLGRWVDMDDDYKTMDTTYTESVWWVFASLYKKNLIYKGFKAMHLCPRCGTTLSNFEVSQNYQDIKDFAVTVKLELADEPGTYLLVWTTTPWTLPGNMAAAVHKDATYIKAKVGDDTLIVAKDRVEVLGEEVEILEEIPGSELVGRKYKPPFEYYEKKDIEGKENAWKIYHADYVSMEDGTGAVHLAPAFGEEDMLLAQKEGIPIVHHVREDGTFVKEVTDFAGMMAKPKDTKDEPEKHMSADIEIIKTLAHKGLLFRKEKIIHSYPLCWRCDTPLLNYASSSWFVDVVSFRDKLVKENKDIHWVPENIGSRRFGNWLENARDWAISRARYWGAPLPVWQTEDGKETMVVDSIQKLKEYTKTSGNTYFLVRHGEAKSNVEGIFDSQGDTNNHLTDRGKELLAKTVQDLRGEHIDMIFVSPLLRTKETAEILKESWGVPSESVIIDERLKEIQVGVFDGKSIDTWREFFDSRFERFSKKPEGDAETYADVRKRAGDFLYEIEKKYSGKKIAIVSHEAVLWLLDGLAKGQEAQELSESRKGSLVAPGGYLKLDFTALPHNENYELDLHRPYIDEIELVTKEGKPLRRVSDVFDCWFESGSMPYGQNHYPFENTDVFEPKSRLFRKSRGYPANFIAEGLDQTRGWFYSLLVLGTALFGKAPYQNVIVNGLVLAEDGQKMSKRLKNYPDPMEVVEKYGADALRFYLVSSPVVRGEDLNFSEAGIDEISKKISNRMLNALAFYKLYAAEGVKKVSSHNILDMWISSRLAELTNAVTQGMESYELDKATRPFNDFVDDFSTWYIRRSRDRFKGDDTEDAAYALATMQYVFIEFSKLIAPFMPFFAEHMYREVGGEKESVHLERWPNVQTVDAKVLADMDVVRKIVSLGLEARSKSGIKVRQPLRLLTITEQSLKDKEELLALVKDEVNVKEVAFGAELNLDLEITPELEKEGALRDLIRHIQGLRKDKNLNMKDVANLVVKGDAWAEDLVKEYEEEIKKAATLGKITFGYTDGTDITLGDHKLTTLLT